MIDRTEKLKGIKVVHSYSWSPDADAKAAGDKRPMTTTLDFSELTVDQLIDHALRHITYRQLQPALKKLKKGEVFPDVHIVKATGTRGSMTEEQRDEKALAKMTPARLARLLERAVAAGKKAKAEDQKRKNDQKGKNDK